MPLPLAYLDAVIIEEVPLDLWRQTFDAIGWPASLRPYADSLSHAAVVASIGLDEPTDELLQFLEVLHTLGTNMGADAIQAALADQSVARDVLPTGASERELAVHLFLAQRQNATLADVFSRAQSQVQDQSEHRRYHEFLGAQARDIRQLRSHLDPIQDAVRAYCHQHDLGDHAHVRAFEDDGTYVFQILRSHRTRKPLAVVHGHSVRTKIAYRPVHCDVIRYEVALGRLRIAAQSPTMVAFYRQSIGRIVFDDDEFFPGAPVCSLRVLQEGGRSILERHEVAEVSRVRMTECIWERGDRSILHLRSPDCFREIEALRLPFDEGALVRAKLKLDVIGNSTRPVSVDIRVPSRIEISQPRYEPLVTRLLSDFGIRGRPTASAAPTIWSLAPWRHPLEVWRSVFGRDVDQLIELSVLRPVRLERVVHSDAPTAGNTLEVVSLQPDRFYGVSAESELAARTLTTTDLDGLELQPESLQQLLRSRLGLSGAAPRWNSWDELLELGSVTLGDQRLYLAYAIRRPPESVPNGLRQRAGGSPIVILCPSVYIPTVDVATAALEQPLPTREQALRLSVAASGMQDSLPALYSAPEGARLVVDRALGAVWLDGEVVPGLKQETQPFRFVTILAEAKGRPVESLAIKTALSNARQDDDTATRQAKLAANKAIRSAMASAGRAYTDDPFPTSGTGRYRCSVPCFVK